MTVNNIVSKEEFDRDLENTRRELEAYSMLVDGFQTLLEMPENSPHDRSIYQMMVQKYGKSEAGCRDFLLKLIGYGEKMGYFAPANIEEPLTQADLTFPEMTPDVLTITDEDDDDDRYDPDAHYQAWYNR